MSSVKKQTNNRKKNNNTKNVSHMTNKSEAYTHLFSKLSKNGVIVDSKINNSFKKHLYGYTSSQVAMYLENPSRYEKELRAVSNFLVQTELHYWRTVMYMTTLARIVPIVIPNNINDIGVNDEAIKKLYFDAVKRLEYMNVKHEFGKIINRMFIEDVFYGIECETSNNQYYIKRLDPDYCRISSISDGCFNFEFDLSYFSKDSTGDVFKGYCSIYPEFKYLMETYKKRPCEDTRWVEIKPSKSICMKLQESLDYSIPPFVASFDDLTDINDYKTLKKNSENVGNFKLIGLQIPLNSKSGKVDDFLVDSGTAAAFYEMMAENLPDGVGAFLTPMIPKEIEFDSSANDQDSVNKAVKSYYDTTGINNMLFSSSDTTGGLAYSTKTDEMLLIGSGGVYRQLERWLNRKFKLLFHGDVTIQLLDVTGWNIDQKKDEYLKAAQYGVPCRVQLSALMGESQSDMVMLNHLENNILKLTDKWIPLSSSHTASAGRPASSDTELSDSAERARDNSQNDNEV